MVKLINEGGVFIKAQFFIAFVYVLHWVIERQCVLSLDLLFCCFMIVWLCQISLIFKLVEGEAVSKVLTTQVGA